jgi:uncharacterized protein (TIGR00369 family)
MHDRAPGSTGPHSGQVAARSGPWQEPVRGGYPSRDHFRRSGREQLEAMLARRIPRPPISRLTGMHLSAVGDGTAAFQMPLTEWLCSPQGAISIGPVTMPADAAVACAIQTALPPATPFTTSELSLRLLAPLHPGGELTARGRLIQYRRRLALAEVAVFAAPEQLVAHGSSLCFVQAPVSLPADGREDNPRPAPGDPDRCDPDRSDPADPDPFQRPAQGTVLPEDVWERMSGLEVLRAQLSGELPAPPIAHLTGLTLTAVEPGTASFSLPATEWLCAPAARRVQGGAVAMLAEAALSAAIQTHAPAGTAIAPVDLKVNYLRPLTADGRPASARGTLVHAGRRIAVANAEVRDGDGRAIAVATGSASLLSGRAASLRREQG